MNKIAPPEILNERSVTIVRLGEDYANFFENMLESLAFLDQLAVSVTPPLLVMDLRHVNVVGSAFLGRMVALHKTVTVRESGRFALCNLSAFCRTAISATHLNSLLEIFPTMDEAVQALSADLSE